MGNSFWETQFVLDPPPVPVERHGDVDLHLPPGDGQHPAVVVVHGVPGPPEAPDARDWPLYRGYGALLAERGVVAAIPRLTVTHPDDLTTVADRIAGTADLLRADPRVDRDRLALWFFSGAGLLLGDWLRDPPRWLRGLAATYPLLAPLPEWPPVDPRFHPIDALGPTEARATSPHPLDSASSHPLDSTSPHPLDSASSHPLGSTGDQPGAGPDPIARVDAGPGGSAAPRPVDPNQPPAGHGGGGVGEQGITRGVPAGAARSVPLVLTRVGRDRPAVASSIDTFLAAAARHGTPVRVVDVPHGQHGFDALDHTDESRAAVRTARDALLDLLTHP
ncbi:hypothetical protein [Micromonospora humi]|uniref:Dienelactone hydrolase n=1 Tax=Micromonospora humi TaxID=745366 RepID=A0A1C5K819_9ACTN|nr:hypothetical protein [Micromonospora humi]SCG78844.1 hypothetical protein GA0070213_1239 [Micromonospora humi]